MKKLLSMLLSATMVVSMVPSLAFAGTDDATKTWEQNGKFMVELQSG